MRALTWGERDVRGLRPEGKREREKKRKKKKKRNPQVEPSDLI
jgi:hypothetical protein